MVIESLGMLFVVVELAKGRAVPMGGKQGAQPCSRQCKSPPPNPFPAHDVREVTSRTPTLKVLPGFGPGQFRQPKAG